MDYFERLAASMQYSEAISTALTELPEQKRRELFQRSAKGNALMDIVTRKSRRANKGLGK